jgi:hypothetical protein
LRWSARLRSGLRDLHMGSVAFVMATGIVSTGEVMFGRNLTSGALLVVAAASYAVLCRLRSAGRPVSGALLGRHRKARTRLRLLSLRLALAR